MARVAVFGLGPMRWEQSTRLFALPLRTWHFAATLARDRHEVLLFSMRTAAFEGWPPDKVTRVERDGVTIYSVSEHLLHERPDWVQAKVDAFRPDCVVGVNKDPAAIAVNFAGERPVWADVNGDPMAEAQAKAQAIGDDRWTDSFHRSFLTVLMRADAFSTCSRAQRAALIGQLSMIGRLTAKNAGHDLVHAIPNSIDDEELRELSRIERRPRAPDDPFVLLWSGGYNTWCDPDLLFEAVDRAMGDEPLLRFVSTGGAIGGHYDEGYARFRARVARSAHAARYAFAGWVQTAELPAYYADAHAAILTDRFGYEGALGARTRMLDWLAAGLPIVTTRLSEISEELEAIGAALASACGDADAMRRHLVRLVREPALAITMGEAGRRHAARTLRADRQLRALREWAAAPARCPDGERRLAFSGHEARGTELGALARQWVARTREAGLREGIEDVRRFAARRAKHRVQRVLDAAGLPGGVEVIEVASPRAAPHEAPRLGALQWRRRLAALEGAPRVAVLVIAREGDDPDVLDWTLEQVGRQYHDAWELFVRFADEAPSLRARVREVAARFLERGRTLYVIEPAVDDPLAHVAVHGTEHLLLLDPGDLLRPDALAELVARAADGADVVYADGQEVDETNAPRPVDRAPDHSPELLDALPYLGSAVLHRTAHARAAAPAWGRRHAASVGYALALHAAEQARAIARVPRVLTQRYRPVRAREPSHARARSVHAERLEALNDSLWRRAVDAELERGPRAGTFRVRYPRPEARRVVIAIPALGPDTRLDRLLRSLARHTAHEPLDVVVATTEPERVRGRARTAPIPAGVDVTGAIEAALRAHDADFVAWLLPETEVVRDGWLDELVRQAARTDVGAAAPKLVAPDGRRAWPRGLDAIGDHVSEVEALPIEGAVLSRARFHEAGGIAGAASLRGAVEQLSARLRAAGARLIATPHAALYVHSDAPSDAPVASARARRAEG